MTKEWVLWGSHPDYARGTAIKLSGGTLRYCKAQQDVRERDGSWLLAIYAKGTEPTGLRLQVATRTAGHWGNGVGGIGLAEHKGTKDNCPAPECGR